MILIACDLMYINCRCFRNYDRALRLMQRATAMPSRKVQYYDKASVIHTMSPLPGCVASTVPTPNSLFETLQYVCMWLNKIMP